MPHFCVRIFTSRLLVIACVLVFFVPAIGGAANRPIPEVVNVKAFARIEHDHLELLVRVPLAAVKDVQFPTRGTENYLDLSLLKSMLPGAARYWVASDFAVADRGTALATPGVEATRISISSDVSFDSYEAASARLQAPELAASEGVFWESVWFDMRFLYALKPGDAVVAINPSLASLGVKVSTDLTFVAADGTRRAFTFEGNPGLIYLDPRWSDAGRQFAARGARIVLTGADFLLFLFCLGLPFRRYRHFLPALATFVGSAAVALTAAALGLGQNAVWAHSLTDLLVAIAILLAACANIVGRVTPRRRALFALLAGSVFGFSSGLSLGEVRQFGGGHPALSSVAFYVGLTLAVTAVAGVLVPVVSFLFSRARVERLERIIVSALAADTAWGWVSARWTELRRIPWRLIVGDGFALAPTLKLLAVLVLVGGVVWFVNEWLKSYSFADEELLPSPARETAA